MTTFSVSVSTVSAASFSLAQNGFNSPTVSGDKWVVKKEVHWSQVTSASLRCHGRPAENFVCLWVAYLVCIYYSMCPRDCCNMQYVKVSESPSLHYIVIYLSINWNSSLSRFHADCTVHSLSFVYFYIQCLVLLIWVCHLLLTLKVFRVNSSK